METLERVDYLSLTTEDCDQYEVSLKKLRDNKNVIDTVLIEGLEIGEQIGLKKGEQIGVAKALLRYTEKSDMEITFETGLTVEEVGELRKTL